MFSFWKLLLCCYLIISVSMCLSAATANTGGGRMISGVYVYKDEPECIGEGGLCVHKSDCLELHTTSGLCPLNAHQGVECCSRIPIRPAPCREHLGECMPRCNPSIQRPATDCADDQVCCVLVG